MNGIQPRDVSLYIPARNAARTLAAAVESVRRQSVAPAECFLVVDTRSTDGTLEIARASGFRIVEQPAGRLGHARNLGLCAGRTPWLASCDADVVLEPEWLAALLNAADPKVAAVGGRTEERLVTPADRWRAVNMPHNWGPARLDNPFMLVSEMLARVAAFRAIGGYRTDLQYYEDSDASQRLRQAGFTLRYEPAAVAWHDRGDSIAAVLELRWQYAAHRQGPRLESLDGLIEKLAVNRTYCLQSLSQALHGPYAETCAISLCLWPHHALRDLRAALALWPLLDAVERGECESRAEHAVVERFRARWPSLAELAASALPGASVAAAGGGPPGAPGRAGRFGATSGFERYVRILIAATDELLATIPRTLDAALESSAAGLQGAAPGAFERPRLAIGPADDQRLAALPLRPAWDWRELPREVAAGADPTRIVVLGAALRSEIPPGAAAHADRSDGVVGSAELLLIPHLEHGADPLGVLRAALPRAATAVVAYQPPELFIPAAPVITARDIAACLAAAGFEIVHFFTRAGLTRVAARRAAPPAPGAPRAPAAALGAN